MGSVYLAQDARNRRLVALKLIRADRISPESVARLQAEFQAIAALHHPRLASADDFGYAGEGGLPYYTREYIRGLPLPSGPARGEDPGEFLRPILDLLEALDYLHAHGILHLDIHPGNLIVSEDPKRGSVLIDFGLIRSLETPKLPTAGGWPWLPPEVLRGGPLTPSADLYLAGRLLLYRLLPPSPSGDVPGEVRLPQEVPGWGPRRTLELERIAAKALQADPRARFASAAEFHLALTRTLGGLRHERRQEEPGELTVGRAAEISRLDEAIGRAACGRTSAVRLIGPGGLGKSRLLAEARLRAQLRGLEVIEARFFPDAGPAPALPRAFRAALPRGRRKA